MMASKLRLFRCQCGNGKQTPAELRVREQAGWHHIYLYHKACGNIESVFKLRAEGALNPSLFGPEAVARIEVSTEGGNYRKRKGGDGS